MDLGFGREGFISHEEEEDQMGKGKLIPFSCSSSSSSSHHKSHLIPLGWDQQMGLNWGEENDGATTARANEVEEESFRQRNSDSSAPDTSASSRIHKEHMFDKVVTPSDVGKLNRLVIPKQHAERYFPLDSSTNEKGLLLNFEDPDGKPWRFRYSYWNSSQSYVMTKGWSRFVKDKKLNAGDIVSFQRGSGEKFKDRLFIDWRRRLDAPVQMSFPHKINFNRSINPWSPMLIRPAAPLLNRNGYYGGYGTAASGNIVNQGKPGRVIGPVYFVGAPQMGMEWRQQGSAVEPVVFDSVPVVQGKAAAKRLRLFGVNMDCPIIESDDDCEIIAAQPPLEAPPPLPPPHFSSSSHNPHQSRLYNGTRLPHPLSSKRKSSSPSLDFDI